MGNYSGTTRCGYCGERGHNRAGCQHLKRRVERERVENPDSWLVRSEDEKARKRAKRATGKRVCAYCKHHRKTISSYDWRHMDHDSRDASGMVEATAKDRWGDEVTMGVEKDTLYGTDGERGVGHSIRACKYHKRDLAARTSEVKARRIDHLKRVIDIGFGPGATVTFSDDGDCADAVPGSWVITSVMWHALGMETGGDETFVNNSVAHATHVTQLFNPRPGWGMQKSVTLPMDCLSFDEETTYRSRYASRVASLARPASEEKIRNSIPFGWADALDEATQRVIESELMDDVKTRSKKK